MPGGGPGGRDAERGNARRRADDGQHGAEHCVLPHLVLRGAVVPLDLKLPVLILGEDRQRHVFELALVPGLPDRLVCLVRLRPGLVGCSR